MRMREIGLRRDKMSKPKKSSAKPEKNGRTCHQEITIDRTQMMQLYEKGLLSGKTLLGNFGFDPDQEIKRKQKDAIMLSQNDGGQSQRDKIQVISSRIEQARRNVEVILRAINSFTEDKGPRKSLEEVLTVNLEIMKETKNIK